MWTIRYWKSVYSVIIKLDSIFDDIVDIVDMQLERNIIVIYFLLWLKPNIVIVIGFKLKLLSKYEHQQSTDEY